MKTLNKSVDYKDYKIQSKRTRKITREWFERCLTKAFTQEDIVRKIKNLSDRDIVSLYRDWIPKHIDIKGEIVNKHVLVIHGLDEKEIEGQVVQEALPAHDSDADDDD
jgi:hypothetical protein